MQSNEIYQILDNIFQIIAYDIQIIYHSNRDSIKILSESVSIKNGMRD